MGTVPLLLSIGILSVILFALVSLLLFRSRKKKEPEEVKEPGIPTFEELKSILKNKDADNETLRDALDEIVALYGEIDPKIDGRPSKHFDKYMELIFIVCKHPNSDKRLVLDFEKDLARKNPQYIKNLDKAVTQGLSFR